MRKHPELSMAPRYSVCVWLGLALLVTCSCGFKIVDIANETRFDAAALSVMTVPTGPKENWLYTNSSRGGVICIKTDSDHDPCTDEIAHGKTEEGKSSIFTSILMKSSNDPKMSASGAKCQRNNAKVITSCSVNIPEGARTVLGQSYDVSKAVDPREEPLKSLISAGVIRFFNVLPYVTIKSASKEEMKFTQWMRKIGRIENHYAKANYAKVTLCLTAVYTFANGTRVMKGAECAEKKMFELVEFKLFGKWKPISEMQDYS